MGACFRIVPAAAVKEVPVSVPLLQPFDHLPARPHVRGAAQSEEHGSRCRLPALAGRVPDRVAGHSGRPSDGIRHPGGPELNEVAVAARPWQGNITFPGTIAAQMHDGWKEPLTPGRCPLYNRLPKSRGFSSVGRAPQWHCGGHGFKSHKLHSDTPTDRHGAVAQLGERHNRTVEVGGSSPPSSTRPDSTKNARTETHIGAVSLARPRQCVH